MTDENIKKKKDEWLKWDKRIFPYICAYYNYIFVIFNENGGIILENEANNKWGGILDAVIVAEMSGYWFIFLKGNNKQTYHNVLAAHCQQFIQLPVLRNGPVAGGVYFVRG